MSDEPKEPGKTDVIQSEDVNEPSTVNLEEKTSHKTEQRQETENTIEDICHEMLQKVAAYFNGDLTATCEDYKLLERLNDMTTLKYQEMSTKTKNLTENMTSLNEKYKALQPFLEQIDYLEEGVKKLEAAAYQLDAYSKQLETKFKKMERK